MPKRRPPPSTVGKRNAAARAAKLREQKKSAKRIVDEILDIILLRVDDEKSSTKVSKNILSEIVDDVLKLEASPAKLSQLPTSTCNNTNKQDPSLPTCSKSEESEDNYAFFSDRNLIEECTR